MHKDAIKNMPYEQIDKTSGEKVKLAIQYDIQPWLLPGVNELAQRKQPLGQDDLALLGPELALKVAAIRESLRVVYRNGLPSLTSGSRDASNVDFTPVIKRAFELQGKSRLFYVIAHSSACLS